MRKIIGVAAIGAILATVSVAVAIKQKKIVLPKKKL